MRLRESESFVLGHPSSGVTVVDDSLGGHEKVLAILRRTRLVKCLCEVIEPDPHGSDNGGDV